MLKTIIPLILAVFCLVLLSAFIPVAQDPGIESAIFANITVNTTPQAFTVACGQGSGAIGRKTLVVENASHSGGTVSVTGELRQSIAGPNFTSGYLAITALAKGSASSDTSTPAEPGGQFCRISAVSASTSTITVTLRRE